MTCERVAPKTITLVPEAYNNPRILRGTWIYSHPTKPMPSLPFVYRFKEFIAQARQCGDNSQVVFDAITNYPTLTNKVNLTLEQVAENMMSVRRMNYMDGSLTLKATEENYLAAAKEVIDSHFAGLQYKYIREGTVVGLKINTSSKGIYAMACEVNSYLNEVVLRGGTLSSASVYRVMSILNKNFKLLQEELE
ncbi:hypothetical protein SHANETTE_84 [Bacillus phage Shanette]|uniref:Uncharacterized protein n=1 Tax=Bacillus phage Shanette TaxID=1296656 RepID=S5M918_9CAUD|nr:hypothetical protein AVV46_gp213 [Bacillus phage Shanette]AGR46978.1 hypothetical protein SHANETTE_84 [Bacillus phage Shanette]